MTRTDFQELAEQRIQEAQQLLNANPQLPDGAYYLAGYAVEFALKACIAKQVNQYYFPDKKLAIEAFTHDLTALVKVAGLSNQLDDDRNSDPIFSKNWTEQSRYRRYTVLDAESLVEAVSNQTSGVLSWVKRHW